MKYQRRSVGLDVHARSVVAWAWTVRPARCSSAGCLRITTRPWNGSGRCRGGGGDVGGRADRPGIVSRNCCCGRGSSTPAGRHGPASTNCGCGCTPSPRLACNWPMRPRSTPCWPPWIAGTVWMPRSRRWPPRSRHPGSDPAGVPARGLDADRVRLATEIGDWGRRSGRSIGAYRGLVPTECSSGTIRSQGGATNAGNSHARQLLIEAAWHHQPGIGRGASCADDGTRRRPRPRAGAGREPASAHPLGRLR